MKIFLLAIAMIATCAPTYAQTNGAAPPEKTAQTAKLQTQVTKQRPITGESSLRSSSNFNASTSAPNHNAGSVTSTVPARHPSPSPKSSATRHLNPNAAVIGGAANTNKRGSGALNGTTMKRKP